MVNAGVQSRIYKKMGAKKKAWYLNFHSPLHTFILRAWFKVHRIKQKYSHWLTWDLEQVLLYFTGNSTMTRNTNPMWGTKGVGRLILGTADLNLYIFYLSYSRLC